MAQQGLSGATPKPTTLRAATHIRDRRRLGLSQAVMVNVVFLGPPSSG